MGRLAMGKILVTALITLHPEKPGYYAGQHLPQGGCLLLIDVVSGHTVVSTVCGYTVLHGKSFHSVATPAPAVDSPVGNHRAAGMAIVNIYLIQLVIHLIYIQL